MLYQPPTGTGGPAGMPTAAPALLLLAATAATGSVVGFCWTIRCATGGRCSRYNGYGCWCGLGGGGEPVDAIDGCCRSHDKCYTRAKALLDSCSPKWQMYDWRCAHLAPWPGVRTEAGYRPLCERNQSACAQAVCQCDALAATCFASHPYPERKPDCAGGPSWWQSVLAALFG